MFLGEDIILGLADIVGLVSRDGCRRSRAATLVDIMKIPLVPPVDAVRPDKNDICLILENTSGQILSYAVIPLLEAK
jgi:signal transduction protein with GAF and PtsI domain